jgi:hypothetical protein
MRVRSAVMGAAALGPAMLGEPVALRVTRRQRLQPMVTPRRKRSKSGGLAAMALAAQMAEPVPLVR